VEQRMIPSATYPRKGRSIRGEPSYRQTRSRCRCDRWVANGLKLFVCCTAVLVMFGTCPETAGGKNRRPVGTVLIVSGYLGSGCCTSRMEFGLQGDTEALRRGVHSDSQCLQTVQVYAKQCPGGPRQIVLAAGVTSCLR